MPILGPDGRPAASFDIPIRTEKVLTPRAAEILRSVTLWTMTRKLLPTLMCKHCLEGHNSPSWENYWSVRIAETATGAILAQCSCTSWVCLTPTKLDASDVPSVAPTVALALEMFGIKKKRPIGTKEFKLLEAWRQVMLDHHWCELMSCTECAKNTLEHFCFCAVIPEKSATFDCACTDRHYRA